MDRACFLKLLHITTEPWVFSSTSKAKFSLIQMNRNSSIKQNYLLEIFTSFIWRVLIKEKGTYTYILYIFQVLYFKKKWTRMSVGKCDPGFPPQDSQHIKLHVVTNYIKNRPQCILYTYQGGKFSTKKLQLLDQNKKIRSLR